MIYQYCQSCGFPIVPWDHVFTGLKCGCLRDSSDQPIPDPLPGSLRYQPSHNHTFQAALTSLSRMLEKIGQDLEEIRKSLDKNES